MGVREGRIIEPRKVEDLKPGDLVQHYSKWEQTYGDPVRREVVKVEFGPDMREHDYVVTWRDPSDSDAEPYDTREKGGRTVDLIVGVAPPPDLCDGVEVPIDGSFADWLPPCVACGQPVAWADALLMPTSSVGPDDEADGVGIVHRKGCGDVPASSDHQASPDEPGRRES